MCSAVASLQEVAHPKKIGLLVALRRLEQLSSNVLPESWRKGFISDTDLWTLSFVKLAFDCTHGAGFVPTFCSLQGRLESGSF
jgi:hypothetical protein